MKTRIPHHPCSKSSETRSAGSPKAPNPDTPQSDIGDEVQKGIRHANQHDGQDGSRPSQAGGLDSPEGKATQFDGNPNPQGDDESGVLKPRDDTPAVLRKRSGPRSG
ncbi:hypothetical protein [Bordetella petrii]|uniref:Uncharacterized protein n=1 Tax=Bordetella petrii TaxID=94624 RepID=A0ABT7W0G9_9BORD|nr:hypothetical protein [Bordetella petrii]MDM9558663.1 hypothetical protein [Bordetella petrii]